MNIAKSQPKPLIELSYSSCNQIHTCPRKYQIRKMFHHPDINYDTGLAATGGTAIHEYLQAKASGLTETEADMAFFDAFDFVIERNDTDWNRVHRSFEACHATAKHVSRELAIQPDEVAKFQIGDQLRPAVEMKFAIMLTAEGLKNRYLYRGAIDLVRFRSFGNVYTADDFKTHRDNRANSDDTDLTHKYRWDTQLTPYGLVISNLTNAAAIPTFKVNYHSIFVDIQEPKVKTYSYSRTSDDVKHWLNGVIRQIKAIEQFSGDECWPRSTTGCDFYNKRCAFYRFCEYEDHDILQDEILSNRDIKTAKPFGEWLTVSLDLNDFI